MIILIEKNMIWKFQILLKKLLLLLLLLLKVIY